MLNKILNDLQGVLRGKNGIIFMVVLALIAIYFFFQLIPILLKAGVAMGLIFLAFKFLEKRK
ncbi:MAG: hypothetical protein RL757_2824 [Bacteroidota bacterium]|jgi:hypothetical protein